jgi:hypothetical protein
MARIHEDRADEAMIAILRQKTPTERLAIAFGLWRSARRMIDTNLRAEHPDWSEEQIVREVARRMSHGTV